MDGYATPPSSDEEDDRPYTDPPPEQDTGRDVNTAAYVIQKHYKSTVVPKEAKKLRRLRKRVVRLQSYIRMFLATVARTRSIGAIVRTQNAFRRHKLRKWPTREIIMRQVAREQFLKDRCKGLRFEGEDYFDYESVVHPDLVREDGDVPEQSSVTSAPPLSQNAPLTPVLHPFKITPSSLSPTYPLRLSYPAGFTAAYTHLATALHAPYVPDKIQSMSIGDTHTLYLTQNGRVFSAGDNTHGQLGYPTKAGSPPPVPLIIEHLYSRVAVPPSTAVVVSTIATGAHHSVALTNDGRLFSFGDNTHGQLGFQTAANVFNKASAYAPNCSITPRCVTFNTTCLVTHVACGSHFTVALVKGVLYAWGLGKCLGTGGRTGQAMPDSGKPRMVKMVGTMQRFSHISAGCGHAMAVSSGGLVYAWGDNTFSQCGVGGVSGENVNAARVVAGVKNVVEVQGGGYHTIARTKGGEVYCWGRNNRGQCGDGEYFTVGSPRKVATPTLVSGVSAGFESCWVLGSDARVYGWGVKVEEKYVHQREKGITSQLNVDGSKHGHWDSDVVAAEPTVTGDATVTDVALRLNAVEDGPDWGVRTGVRTAWSRNMTVPFVTYYVDAVADEMKRKNFLRRSSMRHSGMSPVRRKREDYMLKNKVEVINPAVINPEWNKFSKKGKFGSLEKSKKDAANDELARRFRTEVNGILSPNPKAVKKREKEAFRKRKEEERKKNAGTFAGIQSLLGNMSDGESSEEETSTLAAISVIEDSGRMNASELEINGDADDADDGKSESNSNIENEPSREMGKKKEKKVVPPPPVESPTKELSRAKAANPVKASKESKAKPPPPTSEPPSPPPRRWPVSKDLENVGMPQRKSVIIAPSSVAHLKGRMAAAELDCVAEDEEERGGSRSRNHSMLQRHSSSVGLEEGGGGGRAAKGGPSRRGISISSLLSMEYDED